MHKFPLLTMRVQIIYELDIYHAMSGHTYDAASIISHRRDISSLTISSAVLILEELYDAH